MTSAPCPDEILRFINTSIASVPYLEALLLLRTDPQRSWDVPAIADRLFLPAVTVSHVLAQLQESGMVTEIHGKYRFQPRSEDLRRMIDLLAECYSKNLVEITRIIHSSTGKKAKIRVTCAH